MISRLLGSQLRRNILSGTLVTAANAVTMLVAYRLYLHYLGYERYGVWLALATVLNGAYFGNLGLSAALTKFVAEGIGRDDRAFVESHIVNALFVLSVLGLVFILALTLLRGPIVDLFKLTGENRQAAVELLPHVGGLILYLLITHILNATLTGLGRLDATNYIQTGGRILGVAATIALLSCGVGIKSMPIGYLISYIAIHIASVRFIKRTADIGLLHFRRIHLSCMKKLLHFGGQFMAGQSLQLLLNPFNKLMLARYAGIGSIPIYEIAYTGSMTLRSLVETGLRALTPEVSRLNAHHSSAASGRISALNRRVTWSLALLVSPIYMAALAAAPFLLALWLGSDFNADIPRLFRIMAIGTFVSLFGLAADKTLLGLGEVRHCLFARVAQVTVTVALVFVLVPASRADAGLAIALALSAGWVAWVLYLLAAMRMEPRTAVPQGAVA